MTEKDIVERTAAPLTINSLTRDLQRCGLAEGQTVLVHTAMSKLGWIAGGPQAVIMALLQAVGDSGTIMMPTHCSDNSEPSYWRNPPIPESWWQVYRDNMPAYDPQRTPTRAMGVVAELFRTWPGVIRSDHPSYSMAAHGPHAAYLTADHDLADDMGDDSPLGKLYELDGHVLLLGVGHGNNTSLHLAEYRANYQGKKRLPQGCAMLVDGVRQWVTFDVLDVKPDDFPQAGAAFEAAHGIEVQRINEAEVHFFRQRAAVDFAIGWLEESRDLS